jgi:hypothetical protein
MPVPVETLRVSLSGAEHTLQVLSFVDRRGRKPYRQKQWLVVRGVEALLYDVGVGNRSTGAFASHLAACTLSESVLVVEKARVVDGTVTQQEFDAGTSLAQPIIWARLLLPPFASHHCPPTHAVFAAMRPLLDPETRNKVRKCSVLPLTPCVSALTEFGRCDATSAILVAVNKVQPASLPTARVVVLTPRHRCSADAEKVGLGDRAGGKPGSVWRVL